MKTILKNLSLMKILAFILALVLLIMFVTWLPQLSMKASAIPEAVHAVLAPSLDALSNNSGEQLIAENGGRQLYLNTETLAIRVVDTATGTVWRSSPEDASGNDEKAPLYINYLDRSGAKTQWDAYTYSIEGGDYRLERIENGFRAVMRMTTKESTNLSEYMPQRISTERYNEIFVDKLASLEESGEVETSVADNYRKALDAIYAQSDDGDSYYNKYTGVPPVSATNLLIGLSKAVGYDTEMLRADCAEYEITVVITEPADFTLTMEVTLEDGDLCVEVPSYLVECGNEDYTLQNIAIYPNFALVEATETDDGFIFVPDGSGALFDLNTYDGGYETYSRPVYNNNYFDTMYNASAYKEDLHMPVFAMASAATRAEAPEAEPAADEAVTDGEAADAEPAEAVEETVTDETAAEATPVESEEAVVDEEPAPTLAPVAGLNGFMGIIEEGDTTAFINVQLGVADTSNGGTVYNKVYASFDTMQYSSVKVFGPYSENDARFLATTDVFDMNCKVRYKLYPTDANYFTMAQDYRDYLMETEALTERFAETPKTFISVISALSLEARVLGIPYEKTLTMTDYNELSDIMDDLQGVNKIVSYGDAFNGGMYNTINRKAELVSKNGKERDLTNLLAKHGNSLYLEFTPARLYREGDGFKATKHGVFAYDGKPAQVLRYDIPSGQFLSHSEGYYLLKPKYLVSTVQTFSEDAKKKGYSNLSIADLGNQLYADYDSNDLVNPYSGSRVVEEALDVLAEGRSLILQNPNADRVRYADYATDISRESSDYGLIRHNIPFRQLVLNGLTNYTTLNVNQSSGGQSYYLLQAMELASMPKYTVTAKSVDRLKEENYNDLYATEYALMAEDIKSMSDTVTKAFKRIGTTQITDHKILDDKVFETTYQTGAKVITNYNTFEVETQYGTLAARGYLIVEGGNQE